VVGRKIRKFSDIFGRGFCAQKLVVRRRAERLLAPKFLTLSWNWKVSPLAETPQEKPERTIVYSHSSILDMQSALDSVYTERNASVQTMAVMFNEDARFIVGIRTPIEDPEWPVIVVAHREDPENSQVAWHIPKAELFSGAFSLVELKYDGHDTTEKYKRLDKLLKIFTTKMKMK